MTLADLYQWSGLLFPLAVVLWNWWHYRSEAAGPRCSAFPKPGDPPRGFTRTWIA